MRDRHSIAAAEILAEIAQLPAGGEIFGSQNSCALESSLLVAKMAPSVDRNIRLVRTEADHYRRDLALGDHTVDIAIFDPESQLVRNGTVHCLFPRCKSRVVRFAGTSLFNAGLYSGFDDPTGTGRVAPLSHKPGGKRDHNQNSKQPDHYDRPQCHTLCGLTTVRQ